MTNADLKPSFSQTELNRLATVVQAFLNHGKSDGDGYGFIIMVLKDGVTNVTSNLMSPQMVNQVLATHARAAMEIKVP